MGRVYSYMKCLGELKRSRVSRCSNRHDSDFHLFKYKARNLQQVENTSNCLLFLFFFWLSVDVEHCGIINWLSTILTQFSNQEEFSCCLFSLIWSNLCWKLITISFAFHAGTRIGSTELPKCFTFQKLLIFFSISGTTLSSIL